MSVDTYLCVKTADALLASAVGWRPGWQIDAWRESPSLVVLKETDGYWEVWSRLLHHSKAAGGAVHDARVAALCLHHGARELWTAVREFSRFSGLMTRNPLVS